MRKTDDHKHSQRQAADKDPANSRRAFVQVRHHCQLGNQRTSIDLPALPVERKLCTPDSAQSSDSSRMVEHHHGRGPEQKEGHPAPYQLAQAHAGPL